MKGKLNSVPRIFGKINSKSVLNGSVAFLAIALALLTISAAFGYPNTLEPKLKQTITSALLLLSFITVLLVFVSFRSMMRSMKEVALNAQKLSDGQLNVSDIIIGENNDLSVLAKSFNNMKANLLFFIDQTRNNILVLSDSIDKVSKNMGAAYEGNGQVAATIQDISNKSQEQLKLVKDTVAKIDDVYKSVSNISIHIDDVERIAANTNSVAAAGRESLNKYDENINIISESMNHTREFISKSRESISEISGVIDFIDKISDKLRLLAVNASIEAARSGEAGKGFSVVANEITKLSETTKERIETINKIVMSILDNSDKVEVSINKSVEDFENGRQMFSDAREIFDQINEKNAAALNQISEVVKEISYINSVTKSTTTLSQKVYDFSSEVSQGTEEAASVIEEELAEFQEINSSMSSLQSLLIKIENLTGRYDTDVKPAAENPARSLKIAVVCPFWHEFWHSIRDGIYFAKKELAAKNTTVEFVPVEEVSEDKYKATVEQCVRERYDGIALVGYFEELAKVVDNAVDHGIPVITYNSEYQSKSKRLAFVGQNAYQSGAVSAEAMIKRIGGSGRLLVVTSSLSIAAHEERRQGFNDTVAGYKGVSVAEVLEVHDSNEEAYKKVKEYLGRDRNIDGIFLTAGGQIGTARVVEEMGLAGKVKIVLYDFMKDILEYIKKGVVTCAIGQDPFRQGRDPAIYLYNYLVKGEKPASDKLWTRIDVVDIENVGHIS